MHFRSRSERCFSLAERKRSHALCSIDSTQPEIDPRLGCDTNPLQTVPPLPLAVLGALVGSQVRKSMPSLLVSGYGRPETASRKASVFSRESLIEDQLVEREFGYGLFSAIRSRVRCPSGASPDQVLGHHARAATCRTAALRPRGAGRFCRPFHPKRARMDPEIAVAGSFEMMAWQGIADSLRSESPEWESAGSFGGGSGLQRLFLLRRDRDAQSVGVAAGKQRAGACRGRDGDQHGAAWRDAARRGYGSRFRCACSRNRCCI